MVKYKGKNRVAKRAGAFRKVKFLEVVVRVGGLFHLSMSATVTVLLTVSNTICASKNRKRVLSPLVSGPLVVRNVVKIAAKKSNRPCNVQFCSKKDGKILVIKRAKPLSKVNVLEVVLGMGLCSVKFHLFQCLFQRPKKGKKETLVAVSKNMLKGKVCKVANF